MIRIPPLARGVLAMTFLSIACTALAEDWPRLRGLDGSGRSSVAFNAPLQAQDILWKVELPGVGHSSPAIWRDQVFLTSADKETAKRELLCLSAVDGHVVWKREFDSRTFKQHNDNSYASASPAVDETGVYFSWTTPTEYTLLALDHDGKDLWKVDLGPFVSQWGSGASPIVVGDVVVMANDQEGPTSSVIGVDHKTGAMRWKIDRKAGTKTASSTPCLFHPKDGPAQLILTSQASGMTSVDPATGKVNWEIANIFPVRTIGSPIATDRLVIGTCGEGGAERHLLAVRPGPHPTDPPAVAYQLNRIPPYVPTPIVKDDLLFLWGDAGLVTCVRAASGETVWAEKVGGAYYGSPVCAGETLWCMSRKGELVGVSATDAFHVVGRLDLGEPTQATPAIANGRMYLRTLTHLICVGK